jgi:chromosomal replication initiation ATPase DnaA
VTEPVEHTIARLEGAGYLPALSRVAERHFVTIAAVVGRNRQPTVMRARKAFCVVLRDTFALSLPEIGALLDRDHTTILSAVKEHESAMRRLQAVTP